MMDGHNKEALETGKELLSLFPVEKGSSLEAQLICKIERAACAGVLAWQAYPMGNQPPPRRQRYRGRR